MNQSSQKSHPKGLYILFATEMWERFNFYGMRAILILFMTKALLFDKVFSSNLYGSYMSLIYLTPLVGGYVADRVWGNKRSIIVGGLVMALGELFLFICGSIYNTNHSLSALFFYSGLGLMITGNGFFKPNISSMVGQLYPKNDQRIDPAYTIFYMGINVGGALGPIICGLVGETGNPADFRWAFLAAGIGMVISVIVQKIYQHKYLVDPMGQPIGDRPVHAPKQGNNPLVIVLGMVMMSALMIALLYIDANKLGFLTYLLIASPILIAFLIFSDKNLTSLERKKVMVIFAVSFFVVFFWSAYEQAGSSLNFFADEQTDRRLGWRVPVWIFYGLLAMLLYGVFRSFKAANKNLGPDEKPLRNGVYVVLAAVAGFILYAIFRLASNGQSVINLDEVPASLFQSLNSIFVVAFAPAFAWLWLKLGKYDPISPTKMALGLLLLALGYLWIAFGVKDIQPGVKVSMIWLTVMYMLHTWGELCLSPIGLSLVNKLAPLKFASLLMAVWFLANAGANKLMGALSALYPDGKTTHFLGYQMKNMYDYFMLFVIMSGVAAGLLFMISRYLGRLMEEKS
jgi:POT family proton-dependent oligopeptide transporter